MQATTPPMRKRDSLSIRLLGITIGVILLVELFIFVPSSVGFRNNWLNDRIQAARLAALALEVAPGQEISDEFSKELLENAEVLSVAKVREDRRELLLPPQEPFTGEMINIDYDNSNWYARTAHTLVQFFHSDQRIMKVTSGADMEGDRLEVLMREAPLRQDLFRYSSNVLWLSLMISAIAGLLIYFMLDVLVVRPMRLVTASIIKFRNNPGAMRAGHTPSKRRDEIGSAQNALGDMETVVSDAFRQRERLAQLGEAVAKINHDLRNSLAAAQLVSDSLAHSEDPRVMRAAPRLERALERAIKLAQDTLQFGKSETPKPNYQDVNIAEIIEEASVEALIKFPEIQWQNKVSAGATGHLDPDHLHRIISNLVRNAAAATSKAKQSEGIISISLEDHTLIIADNGPGLPEKTVNNLFVPFAGSTTKGGTGLGLVIARDLSQAMGGDLKLRSTGTSGTVFYVELPARS